MCTSKQLEKTSALQLEGQQLHLQSNRESKEDGEEKQMSQRPGNHLRKIGY